MRALINPSMTQWGATLTLFVATACDSGLRQPSLASEGQIPERVAIGSASMTSGFASGMLREQRTLTAFEISMHPTTAAEFSQCVAAGACSAESPGCTSSAFEAFPGYPAIAERSDDPNAAALCIDYHQAAAYCSWVGGRLPTLDEWLLASRGDSPKRYSWGDAQVRCEQHPYAPYMLGRTLSNAVHSEFDDIDTAAPSCAREVADATPLELVVGEHPTGASVSGIEDVMLAPAELVASDDRAMFNACGTSFPACLVYGSSPAALDSVQPVYSTDSQSPRPSNVSHAYAFRCAWQGSSR